MSRNYGDLEGDRNDNYGDDDYSDGDDDDVGDDDGVGDCEGDSR